MEFLGVSISSNPTIFCKSFTLSPPSSLTSLTQHTLLKTPLKPYRNPQFRPIFPTLTLKNLPISSHFRRPTRRRNSLRKKLISDLEVRQNPKITHNFVDNEVSRLNLDAPSSVESAVDEVVSRNGDLEESRKGGDSVLWNKLENWVEQYKKDVEFWGIGSGPVFTVYQDSSGSSERVSIDEDEILKRSGVDSTYFREERELEGLNEVKSKISHARFLAKEMESGRDVIPKHSTVAKFVVSGESSGFLGRIKSVSIEPGLFRRVSRIGIVVVFSFVFVWATTRLFGVGGEEKEMTRLAKEMMRRKMKSRMERESLKKGSVEAIQESSELPGMLGDRPHLDKEELLNSIRKVKGSNNELAVLRSTKSTDMDIKIQEIRRMARHAREIERAEGSQVEGHEQETRGLNDSSIEKVVQEHMEKKEKNANVSDEILGKTQGRNSNLEREIMVKPEIDDVKSIGEVVSVSDEDMQLQSVSSGRFREIKSHNSPGVVNSNNDTQVFESTKGNQSSNIHSSQLSLSKEITGRKKPRVIRSVKEAREYLLQKNERESRISDMREGTGALRHTEGTGEVNNDASTSETKNVNSGISDPIFVPQLDSSECASVDTKPTIGETKIVNGVPESTTISGTSVHITARKPHLDSGIQKDFLPTELNFDEVNMEDGALNPTDTVKLDEADGMDKLDKPSNLSETSDRLPDEDAIDGPPEENVFFSIEDHGNEDSDENHREGKLPDTELPHGSQSGGENTEAASSIIKESWVEKNFQEFDLVVQKIGDGFRNNYMGAREKANQNLDKSSELANVESIKNDTELEWMKDDKLREIVFRVRDNELAGHDPFHSMHAEDKLAFFKGLEREVEKENEKLSTLHEWLHSNIENLDYGADGISLYDPPEKIIPRWKGPPLDKIPEFLTNTTEQQEKFLSNPVERKEASSSSLQEANESSARENIAITQNVPSTSSKSQPKASKSSKTVIEASDGSVKPGKKSGKEYWQHTKKWSRGFLESYNAETDPEAKAVMKDIGKDLDRWITEKEIEEAAEFMDKMPQKGREFIEKKLNKLKREMELYGPQAVVSKYCEYAEEKEEDYLWWLDLPYVLCIELYTYEGGDVKVGFYSLEMATDLELDPKPCHVIAFEDPSDCKNLCYIIQAHMEMLDNGKAFVVAQPPKDAFGQAKANGFGVTVIRKGELQLNIDQPLEEVEEQITEIGSKMYHDKITRERSVDISALMKGVFGVTNPTKRKKLKRRRKKPSKR